MYVIAARKGDDLWNLGEEPVETVEQAQQEIAEFAGVPALHPDIEIAIFELVRVA